MREYRQQVIIERSRVMQTLQERSGGRMLVVEGESGIGKTMAVQQMMRNTPRDWLYWCEGQVHMDAGLKWRHFCEVVKAWNPTLGEKLVVYGIPDSMEMYRWVAEQVNRHIKSPLDFQKDCSCILPTNLK